MRIAFLAFNGHQISFADALLTKLVARGHEVIMFYVYTVPALPSVQYPCINERWNWFEFANLNKFNPDRIIMFNGCSRWTYAAKKYFESVKGEHVLTIERGWLPQRDYNYIADTLAPHSFLEPLVAEVVRENRLPDLCEELKQAYVAKPVTDIELPPKFLFYPCQLDLDTSITLCSPYFKTNESLLGFVRWELPDTPIVVKNHPHEPNTKRREDVVLYQGEASTLDLMAASAAVIGNNSTCLCEALALGKQVFSFGNWIGQAGSTRLGLDYAPLAVKESLDKIIDPRENGVYSAANAIHRLQWKIKDPEEWVADLVEQGTNNDRVEILRKRLGL